MNRRCAIALASGLLCLGFGVSNIAVAQQAKVGTAAEAQSVLEKDFDAAVEQYHLAAREFVKGNPEPYKMVYSHRDDVTLGNPFGPIVRGWQQVATTLERAASNYRDGEFAGWENVAKYVTPELAYIVEFDRLKAKIGGSAEFTPVALRATSVFRREDNAWKLVHRHADPITAPRPAESVIQK
jgi:ketosteroid isomerase-like protein